MGSVTSNPVSQPVAKNRHFPAWAAIVGVVAAVSLVAIVGVILRMNYVPDNLDTSTRLMSEQGSYQVSYESEFNPIPINQIQSWTISVTQPNGEPVENAEITVDGDMPQHGHGLPTVPHVTEYLGDGRYRVEGLKFHMPGWWIVTFKVTYNATTDSVTFNLMLN